jgi:hypothetical protein
MQPLLVEDLYKYTVIRKSNADVIFGTLIAPPHSPKLNSIMFSIDTEPPWCNFHKQWIKFVLFYCLKQWYDDFQN